MKLVLIHIDDAAIAAMTATEEASIIVPGGPRVVTMAPLHAIPQLVPALRDGLGAGLEQRCRACGGDLASLPDPPRDL